MEEMVRQHNRETGYHEILLKARKEHMPEPDIPALPKVVADKVSKPYIDIYERMTRGKGLVPPSMFSFQFPPLLFIHIMKCPKVFLYTRA